MRNRIPYRVCRCMPNGVVTHLEARLLKDLVNREILPIRCATSCKQKFMKGMRIGDLCAETGHFWWALKVWKLTANLIEHKDWDDWINVHFNTEWCDLQDVISETEYELLLKRCGDMYQALGFPKEKWWSRVDEHYAERYYGLHAYYWLFVEKHYGYYFFNLDPEGWEDKMRALYDWYKTEKLFREGQGDYLPRNCQSLTEYLCDSTHCHLDDLSCFEIL